MAASVRVSSGVPVAAVHLWYISGGGNFRSVAVPRPRVTDLMGPPRRRRRLSARVKAKAAAAWTVRVGIADEGVGMTEAEMAELFRPYSQIRAAELQARRAGRAACFSCRAALVFAFMGSPGAVECLACQPHVACTSLINPNTRCAIRTAAGAASGSQSRSSLSRRGTAERASAPRAAAPRTWQQGWQRVSQRPLARALPLRHLWAAVYCRGGMRDTTGS